MSEQQAEHGGPGHGDVVLSLTWDLPDGGRLHQSWTVCECTATVLRGWLGPAQSESRATAAQYRDLAEYAREHGGVHRLPGDTR